MRSVDAPERSCAEYRLEKLEKDQRLMVATTYDLGHFGKNRILLVPIELLFLDSESPVKSWSVGSANHHGHSYNDLYESVTLLNKTVVPRLLMGKSATDVESTAPVFLENGHCNWRHPTALVKSYFSGDDAIAVSHFDGAVFSVENGRHRILCAKDAGIAYLPVRWASAKRVPDVTISWDDCDALSKKGVFDKLSQGNAELGDGTSKKFAAIGIERKQNMSHTSYDQQYELLIELERYLTTLRESLSAACQEYKLRLDNLGEAGMIRNIHNNLVREVMEPTVADMTRLITQIEERDISKVRAEKEEVSSQLARLA